jgi:lipoprotein-releasing system permease protein
MSKAARRASGTYEVPQPWTVGEAVGVGFTSFLRAPVVLMAAWLVPVVIAAGLGVSSTLLEGIVANVLPPTIPSLVGARVITQLIAQLVSVFFWGGALKMWLAAARGEPVAFVDVFLGGRFFLRLLALRVLILVLWAPSTLALGIPLWGVLLAPFYVVDGDAGIFAALRQSWRATRGHKGMLWVFGLCSIPILIMGLALLGVGVAAAEPMIEIALAFIYVRVSGRGQIGPFPPSFAPRSMRYLLRTTLTVFAAAFAGLVYWVRSLPTVHGSAFTFRDAGIRAGAVVMGVATTIVLLATLLPWILDRFEGRNFSLFVAARHVRSQKSGFLTVLSVLGICGVAIGGCALSSTISVMGGFSQDLKRKILGNNAHIVIDTTAQKPWSDGGAVLGRVRAVPGVVGATPVVQGEVMAASSSNNAGVIVKGIDPQTIGDVIDLKKNIEVGKFDYLEDPEKLLHLPANEVIGLGPGGEKYLKGADLDLLGDNLDPSIRDQLMSHGPVRPGLIVGRELAKTLHLYVGDELTLVSPLGDLGPMGVMPRTKKFRIAAIFYSGMYEYDASHVYTLISTAQEYFAMEGKISAIDVKVEDAERADQLRPQVETAVARDDLRVRDWREMNKNLFSALKLERLATFIILSIMIIVASFCIICMLLLMVTEKGKEIAILKAIGASDGAILRTFMLEGVIIGGIGTVFGVTTGLALCAGLAWFGLRLDPDVYYIDRLPVHVSGWDFLAVATAAMVICTLATLYPAWAASRLRPVDGLRYE